MKNVISSERVDLFEPNIYIQFLVKITSDPTVDDLLKAVKEAFLANESTMSKIVLTEDGTAFYEKLSESGCSVTVTQKDWEVLIRENEKLAFQIDKGEMMRVFIITSDDEIRMLIMAHHLVGDGKSVAYFLEDVMRALSGEKIEYKPLHLINEDLLPKESNLPPFYKLYAHSFNRKWRRNRCTFNWEDYYHIHEVYWREKSSNIICKTFSVEDVDKLCTKAQKMGISVNSLLTTAFLRANPENGCIGMPVDARNDHNRSMANQATGISVDHYYSEKRSFEENAGIVHQKVHKKLDSPVFRYFILRFLPLFDPALLDSILFATYDLCDNKTSAKLAEVMGYKGGKTRELGITNLTRLDIPDTYGSYGIKNVLFVPPVVSYAKHIIGVVTTGDGMRISYHFMSDQDAAEEKKFFERAMENL